jgi:6-phosphogluconolactonase (cycloisomerase 2 family)
VENHLIVTEKSNVIETVLLNSDGAVAGAPTVVQNIPANVNTPFGLVTRGNNAYVTIAHADETSLIRNGQVLTTTPTASFSGPVQHSPCWLTLVGPFLYASNSPSSSISRYAVYGQKIVPDQAVAATLNGAPTDIASGEGLVAVIDGNGPLSHLSVFHVDEDGNLTLQGAATIAGAANGVAVVGAITKADN